MRGLTGLLQYHVDIFSFDPNEGLELYGPYEDLYPSKQVEALKLLDEIEIPHEKRKQEPEGRLGCCRRQFITYLGLQIEYQLAVGSISWKHEGRLKKKRILHLYWMRQNWFGFLDTRTRCGFTLMIHESDVHYRDIFFNEALAPLSAINLVANPDLSESWSVPVQ